MAQKSFWTHPRILLGDKAQLEAHFGQFRDSANLDTRSVHGLRQTYHRLRNRFWTHSMVLLGDETQLEARFGPSRDSDKLNARLVHGLHRTYRRLRNHFGHTG
jgi:hypothetical protein